MKNHKPTTVISISVTGTREQGFTARFFANGFLVHQVQAGRIVDALSWLGVLEAEVNEEETREEMNTIQTQLETVSASTYQALARMVQAYGKRTVEKALETLPPDTGEQFEVRGGITIGDRDTRMS